MRGLQTSDIALFSKAVHKMELKNQLNDLFVSIDGTGMTEAEIEAAKEKANQELGINMMVLIVENYWKAEKEIIALLADMSGKTQKGIRELPLDEFATMLAHVKNDESIGSFFNLVTQ